MPCIWSGCRGELQRVGRAPYLVDRDGTIFKTFDDAGWIYHLGLNGAKGRYDRSALGIEFANEGPLTLDGDRLYALGMNTPNTIYTGLHFAGDWRDREYFAELDEAQIDAGIELTLDTAGVTRSTRCSITPRRSSISRAAFTWRRSSVTPTAGRTSWTCTSRIGCSRKSRPRGIRLQS